MATSMRDRAEAAVVAGMEKWARPMQWGKDDCMLAVADIIWEIIGKDPAEEYRGRYRSRTGAIRVLGRGGTLNAASRVAEKLNWKSIEPTEAEVGDFGLTLVESLDSKGNSIKICAAVICRGSGYFIGRNENGFTAINSSKVFRAWRIG